MYAASPDVVTFTHGPRLLARLGDGRVIDLQLAHIALRGAPSPHLRSPTALRLAASYGEDLVRELAMAAPSMALVAS